MPPNLLVKAAFVRGDFDENYEKLEYKGKTGVRTDFILQNIYSYLLRDRYHFNCIRHMNKKEEEVLNQLKETVNAFQIKYGSTVKSLCTEVDDVSVETVGTVLLGVANELFCEGITWGRIIGLFVFVGELILLCLSQGLPEYMVDLVYECFSRLVKENLESWVFDHEGWEGITSLSIVAQESALKVKNQGWAKSLLYSTVRMLGTAAHIANYSNQVVP